MEVLFYFQPGRGETYNRIQQQFYAIAQCSGAAHNRRDAVAGNTCQKAVINFFLCQFDIVEEFFHQFIAAFCRNFNQHGTEHLNFIFLFFRHFASLQLTYFLSCVPFNQVDKANEITIFIVKRNLQRSNSLAKFRSHICKRFFKVSIFIIHLVDKNHSGHMHFFCIFPCLFRTYFHAGFCRNHNQRGIRDIHCQLCF